MIDWDNPPANDKPSKLPPAVRRRLIWTGGVMLGLFLAIAGLLVLRH